MLAPTDSPGLFSLASSEDTGKYFCLVINLITVLKVFVLLCDLDALKKCEGIHNLNS